MIVLLKKQKGGSGLLNVIKKYAVWFFYEIKNKCIRKYVQHKNKKINPEEKYAVYKARPTKVKGRALMLPPEVNQIITQKINTREPFWAGRMGYTEMDFLRQVIEHRLIPRLDYREDALNKLCLLSGFFPNRFDLGERFADLYLQDCQGIDMQGFWGLYMEDYLLSQYQNTKYWTQLNWLEPWNMYLHPESDQKPWTAALKGKKVLVVHPFADSIEKQYRENREKIFEKVFEADDILPEFELLTIKAVQSLGGTGSDHYSDWFEALEWMKQQCRKKEFDVAIIGCGAYGYPLAAEIKRMGKIAVHLGGAVQLLFGIIGSRWETEYKDFYQDVVNEYWVRPAAQEKPQCAGQVENECYW